MNSISIFLIPLWILFGILIMILLIYFISRMAGGKNSKSTLHLPDPRYMGSTAFLAGVSGTYKDAVVPIPMEGIIIGSDAEEANIILRETDISPQHVRVAFPEGRYDSILVENLEASARTFYSAGNDWLPLWGEQCFSPPQPVKIKIGTNQDIFEIIFRS